MKSRTASVITAVLCVLSSVCAAERPRVFVLTDIERDGDELECAWFYHPEPGTFTTSSGTSGKPLTIMDADKQRASFFVPAGRVLRSGTKHIILGATDRGSPPLTRCKRVILEVEE